ncbi:MAG: efflux RND transporter periplasmic adaptor subunit [Hyphomonadaceae bacterium]|nr:efflux RND transporter periplasmic adaptor subunit [Hyphomonadaceae bacterium]
MTEAQKPMLRTRRVALLGAIIAGTLAIGAGGYWLGASRSPAGAESQAGREIAYWYDPMLPNERYPGPGRSSMGMELIPRYADEISSDASVRIEPGVVQNLGVRLASVESAPLTRSVRAAGVLAFNERNLAVVQARAGGFVERGYGRVVGDVVSAGSPIVDVRMPEWTAAQAEYLALRQAGGDLALAARQRLAMLGMPASLIERIEREGRPRPVTTITAPVAGAITALDIRPGMTIMQGAPLATINAMSPVWLIASLPQADAGVAERGGRVVARVPAYPGESFAGRIETVLPSADAATRTIEVRVALSNSDMRLRPGMTAEVELAAARAETALVVPAEAVIQTGRRTVVIVALEDNRFAPTEVELGRRADDRIEIRSGLVEGQRVVASGQFLIDSEASLSGALQRLETSAQGQPGQVGATHEAQGRIAALDGANISIAHGAVTSLNWPAMTMQFRLRDEALARGLRTGDAVSFRFRQDGQTYIVTEIEKTGARP